MKDKIKGHVVSIGEFEEVIDGKIICKFNAEWRNSQVTPMLKAQGFFVIDAVEHNNDFGLTIEVHVLFNEMPNNLKMDFEDINEVIHKELEKNQNAAFSAAYQKLRQRRMIERAAREVLAKSLGQKRYSASF